MRKIYGHLGTVRHRAKVVEYRVAQHAAKLGDRLTSLYQRAKLGASRKLFVSVSQTIGVPGREVKQRKSLQQKVGACSSGG